MAEEWRDVDLESPSRGQEFLARGKRAGAIVTKGLFGDVPFVRKLIPESIKQVEPNYGYEKALGGATTLGRDIGLLKGVGKLGLLKTGLRGAGVGMATAASEKPEEIAAASVTGAIALPIIKKGTDVIGEQVIKPLFQKGLKTSRQMWQDLLRAGFMVEKSSVERAQNKGIDYLMNKKSGFRNSDAFLKLGERIHNDAIELRRYWGDKVGRYRDMISKNPRVKVSIENPRQMFIDEITKPEVGALGEVSTESINRLNQIKDFLNMSEKEITPNQAYILIDKLDGMLSESKKGALSLGKNTGRIVANLSRDIKKQIYKSAPRYISERLKSVEGKFGEVADVTDDVFDKLQFTKEGVATKERIGAAESALKKGLSSKSSAQERVIWERLNNLLPSNKKFMETYKDIFAANDFSQEGIGWLMRRLALAPRMAAKGMSIIQPVNRAAGMGIKAVGKAGKQVIPPVLFRKSIQGKSEEEWKDIE